jgi:hypothetical protein
MWGVAESNLRNGVVWYTEAPEAVCDLAAQRYDVGVTGKDHPANKITIKSMNPDFRWFVYNSATDNYLSPSPSEEHDLLAARAAARGWDAEEAYLHYYDDTQIVLQGDTLFIPGWGDGTASGPSEARIPVYYKNLTRRVTNFSTPHALTLNKEVFVELALGTPFEGSSLYADGIFLDNCAAKLFNYGQILSGGHVRETPGNPLIGSAPFQTWQWSSNLGPFLTALKDTLETADTWCPDGKRKYLMINVANIWDDGYVSRDAADVIFMEFQYNPVRNFGLSAVDEAYRRDALAAAGGISCFYPATMTTSYGGYSMSYADIMVGNLAWYLITRTQNSIFFEFATASPHVAGWDTLTWRGVLDVADLQLGQPVGDPFTLAQGTDPMGNPYVVKARSYEGGLAVLRNRGEWNQGIEPQTAVTVDLPALLMPLTAAGSLGTPVHQVSLRNGQGALFLNSPVSVPVTSFTADWRGNIAVIRWETDSPSTDYAGFRVYREAEGGDRVPISPLITDALEFEDEASVSGGRYWLQALSRSGDASWYGPAVLAPAASVPGPGLTLAQNRPNPSRGTTAIAFTVERTGPVRLSVFDVNGREVARLLDAETSPGPHAVTWNGTASNGSRSRPGTYFYRLVTPSGTLTRKLTLLP